MIIVCRGLLVRFRGSTADLENVSPQVSNKQWATGCFDYPNPGFGTHTDSVNPFFLHSQRVSLEKTGLLPQRFCPLNPELTPSLD